MTGSRIRLALRLTFILVCLTAPALYAAWRQNDYRNFRVVRPGVLYRSSQTTPAGLERILHDYNIRTVISLRDAREPGQPPPDAHEERICQRLGVRYVRITPRPWEAPGGGRPPVQEGVDTFIRELSNPLHHPVLVHCCAGIHRTGAYCALFRMKFEGWSNDQAIAELKAMGYVNLDRELDILGYLKNFDPRTGGPRTSPTLEANQQSR